MGLPALRVPDEPPAWGSVRLRSFTPADVGMLVDLATDPYVSLIGTLPHRATEAEALAYVERQLSRTEQGVGWSFCVADRATDDALGGAGLWVVPDDPHRMTAGYSVAPRARGRGVATEALRALAGFAWTLPEVDRVELHVEPDNAASLRVAEAAGFSRLGVLPDQEFRGADDRPRRLRPASAAGLISARDGLRGRGRARRPGPSRRPRGCRPPGRPPGPAG